MNDAMSPAVRRVLRGLGEDVALARRKRRIRQTDLAARMGVSVGTVRRLESGYPGVGIGTLAMAILAFGNVHGLSRVLAERDDEFGLMLDREELPQRIRPRKSAELSRAEVPEPLFRQGPDGVLF